MLDIRKYLSHRAEIVQYNTNPGSPDPWGGVSHYDLEPVPVDCLVYFGSTELNLETMVGIPRMIYSGPTKWQIILPKQYMATLHVKDRIQNIVRKRDNSPIRQDGYVQMFKIYEHHRHGAMFVLGLLSDGDEPDA